MAQEPCRLESSRRSRPAGSTRWAGSRQHRHRCRRRRVGGLIRRRRRAAVPAILPRRWHPMMVMPRRPSPGWRGKTEAHRARLCLRMPAVTPTGLHGCGRRNRSPPRSSWSRCRLCRQCWRSSTARRHAWSHSRRSGITSQPQRRRRRPQRRRAAPPRSALCRDEGLRCQPREVGGERPWARRSPHATSRLSPLAASG